MNFENSDLCPTAEPLILLSGDNTRSTRLLQRALVREGFGVEFAPGYPELEAQWGQRHHPMVLLEVSGPHGVEDAVSTALSLKRRDPGQFIAYLADPALHTCGLAGDAVFPRVSRQLATALKRYFDE